MKKIIYIIIIIIIICLTIFYKKSTNKDEYIETESLVAIEEMPEQKEELKIKVHIVGAVKSPGIVELSKEARIEDAINQAGGVTEEVDLSKINLAYKLEDGIKIYIPSIFDNSEISIISNEAGENVLENAKVTGKININKATQEELKTLPGIGESIASNIIKYREKKGKFKSVEDVKNVDGIGEAKYKKIIDEICI